MRPPSRAPGPGELSGASPASVPQLLKPQSAKGLQLLSIVLAQPAHPQGSCKERPLSSLAFLMSAGQACPHHVAFSFLSVLSIQGTSCHEHDTITGSLSSDCCCL